MGQTLLYVNQSTCALNMDKYVSNIINKSHQNEYISNNSVLYEGKQVNEEFTNISEEHENAVIMYLLEIMRRHDIITDKEYRKVLYKCS